MVRKSTEIRQEEIKKSVLNIIKTEGIKAVSTKNLALYVGLSEGAIFRHFKTKRDIIVSIIDDVSTDLIGGLRKISNQDLSPEERLHRCLCFTITYLTENNGITILLFTEASQTHDEEMIGKLDKIFNSQREIVGRIITEGMDSGIWNKNVDVEDITMLYMGIPITHNINLILSKNKKHKYHFCNRMMELFERILVVK